MTRFAFECMILMVISKEEEEYADMRKCLCINIFIKSPKTELKYKNLLEIKPSFPMYKSQNMYLTKLFTIYVVIFNNYFTTPYIDNIVQII